jgi:hypothetical protein
MYKRILLFALLMVVASIAIAQPTIDPATNFANTTVTTGYDASAATIVVATGYGDRFPQPSTDGAFNVIWYNATDYPNPSNDPNREIVRVTARSSDTFTITRAQEGTSATTKNTGGKTYRVFLGITAKTITDLNTRLDSTHSPILNAVAGQVLYQIDNSHTTGVTIDSTKLKYVNSFTSNPQTQLDAKMPKTQVQTKEFTVLDTVKTGGETVWSWKVPYAITITQVSAYTDANTVTFQLEERAAATPNTTGTAVMTSSLVADNNEQTTTSFTNAGQAANTWLTAVVSAAGDVSRFCVTIWYTID